MASYTASQWPDISASARAVVSAASSNRVFTCSTSVRRFATSPTFSPRSATFSLRALSSCAINS